jgi:glucose-1-phosphate cytidylyltransferase
VNLGDQSSTIHHGNHEESNWSVTVANTGESTMTGGRVYHSLKYLDGDRFLCTYGDGLADINLQDLVKFHVSHGKKATVTTVQPLSRFGVMDVGKDGIVEQFREKPIMDGWVNAGFFIFEKSILEYLDEDCVLEQGPLSRLAADSELAAYRHNGFWQPMDTLRESNFLNELWSKGEAPWKNWD